jgi:hypothetical protein
MTHRQILCASARHEAFFSYSNSDVCILLLLVVVVLMLWLALF